MSIAVEQTRPFRVLIAGGSITGLSLALILEKAGIDYILLEKREIAPQFGASVGYVNDGLFSPFPFQNWSYQGSAKSK
jgi:glycine/D-amino acid oxidase-like deaminating enzyme